MRAKKKHHRGTELYFAHRKRMDERREKQLEREPTRRFIPRGKYVPAGPRKNLRAHNR